MISKKVQKYCCEPIENVENYYEAVNSTERYDCHHKDEIDLNMSQKELIEAGLYYNVSPERLIFIPFKEHSSLHMKGKSKTNDENKKNSEAHIGNKNPAYKRICPLQLWALRKINNYTWKQICIELNICLLTTRRKWRQFNLDNFKINII